MKPKPQLLIVDNNVSILRLLSNFLGEEYDIVAKLDPIEAYAWLQDGHHPALTIIDINAGDTPAFSLVKNLKISGMYRGMPLVILSPSGQSDGGLLQEQAKSKDAYMEKPFSPGALKDTIKRLLTTRVHHVA